MARETQMEWAWITMNDARYAEEQDLRNRILLRPIGQADGAWEHRDAEAFHLVATEKNRVVGCTLLLPHSAFEGQLMQMAVDAAYQGRGIGAELVGRLFAQAKSIGLQRIFCHARAPVVDFYSRLGFVAAGPRFEEVGIEHQKMVRELAAALPPYAVSL